MSRLLLGFALLLALPIGVGSQTPLRSPSASDAVIAGAKVWVETWNKKDVKRMRQLHAGDVAKQRYAIGDQFVTVKSLLDDIEKEKFWNLSWSIKMVDPVVRLLGSDAALISFRLVGTETNGQGVSKPFSTAFSLVYQRFGKEWKIVHLHDSSATPPS